MVDLTPDGQRVVDDAAQRYALSPEAVRAVVDALATSGGQMAQFNHPELGGMGQWSSGGMIMIGDMFNSDLKSRIGSLCAEMSDAVAREDIVARPPHTSSGNAARFGGGANWWPSELGVPGSTGSQNSLRYAWFPDRRRLALDISGRISVYDTGDHSITGFSQQQNGNQSINFTGQHGAVRLDSLDRVSDRSGPDPSAPVGGPNSTPALRSSSELVASPSDGDAISIIERLGGMRDQGFISEVEFSEKKLELLKRL